MIRRKRSLLHKLPKPDVRNPCQRWNLTHQTNIWNCWMHFAIRLWPEEGLQKTNGLTGIWFPSRAAVSKIYVKQFQNFYVNRTLWIIICIKHLHMKATGLNSCNLCDVVWCLFCFAICHVGCHFCANMPDQMSLRDFHCVVVSMALIVISHCQYMLSSDCLRTRQEWCFKQVAHGLRKQGSSASTCQTIERSRSVERRVCTKLSKTHVL